jgi:hypothetical protein
MKRREFITLISGAAASLSRPARAQQPGRPRRIAVLMGVKQGDPEGIGRLDALVAGLKEPGWIDGDTAKFEVYSAGGSVSRIREILPGLVASEPDVIVNGTAVTGEMHKSTQTIPVVFNLTADPTGLGYIESMSRPGGNLTGFILFKPPLVGKWFDFRRFPPNRRLWRSRAARRKVGQPSGAGADEVSARSQSADGKETECRVPADAAGAGRRGDRMILPHCRRDIGCGSC